MPNAPPIPSSNNPASSSIPSADPSNYPPQLENLFAYDRSTPNQIHASSLGSEPVKNSSFAFSEGSSHLAFNNLNLSQVWPSNQTKHSHSTSTKISPSSLHPSLLASNFPFTSPLPSSTQSFMPMLPSNPILSPNADLNFPFQTQATDGNWNPSSVLPSNLSHLFQAPPGGPLIIPNSSFPSQNSLPTPELLQKNPMKFPATDASNDLAPQNTYASEEEKLPATYISSSSSSTQLNNFSLPSQISDPQARPHFISATANLSATSSTLLSLPSNSSPTVAFPAANLRSPSSTDLPSNSMLPQLRVPSHQQQHQRQQQTSSSLHESYLSSSNAATFDNSSGKIPQVSFEAQTASIHAPNTHPSMIASNSTSYPFQASSFTNTPNPHVPMGFMPVQSSSVTSEMKEALARRITESSISTNDSINLQKNASVTSLSTHSSHSNASSNLSLSSTASSSTKTITNSINSASSTTAPHSEQIHDPLRTHQSQKLPYPNEYPYYPSENPRTSIITNQSLPNTSQDRQISKFDLSANPSINPSLNTQSAIPITNNSFGSSASFQSKLPQGFTPPYAFDNHHYVLQNGKPIHIQQQRQHQTHSTAVFPAGNSIPPNVFYSASHPMPMNSSNKERGQLNNTMIPPSITPQHPSLTSSSVAPTLASQARQKRMESPFPPGNPPKVKKQKNAPSLKVIKDNSAVSVPPNFPVSNHPPHYAPPIYPIPHASDHEKPVVGSAPFPIPSMAPPSTSSLGFVSARPIYPPAPHSMSAHHPSMHPPSESMVAASSSSIPPHATLGLTKIEKKYPSTAPPSIMTIPREVLSVVPIETAEMYLANERRWEQHALRQRSRRTMQLIEEKVRQLEWISESALHHLTAYGNPLGPLPLPHLRLLQHTLSRKGGGGSTFSNKADKDFLVVLPSHKAHLGELGYHLKDYDFTSDQHQHSSRIVEELVPIRLEVMDVGDTSKLRDCFSWNVHNTSITPERFVDVLLQDTFGTSPPPSFKSIVVQSIEEQLADFLQFRKPVEEMQQEDLRILIKLNVTVGTVSLVDQFEWDLACERNNPEQFAEAYCKDLGLNGEFRTAIAHNIREQTHIHIKSLLLAGYSFDGSPIALISNELADSFLIPVEPGHVQRNSAYMDHFTPMLFEMTEDEVERQEKDTDRDARRKRRGHRKNRALLTLPVEADVPKTRRTPILGTPIRTYYIRTSDFPWSLTNLKAKLPFSRPLPTSKAKTKEKASSNLHFKLDQWTCGNCNCPFISTAVARRGPQGDHTLCNACGLHYLNYGQLRPLSSHSLSAHATKTVTTSGFSTSTATASTSLTSFYPNLPRHVSSISPTSMTTSARYSSSPVLTSIPDSFPTPLSIAASRSVASSSHPPASSSSNPITGVTNNLLVSDFKGYSTKQPSTTHTFSSVSNSLLSSLTVLEDSELPAWMKEKRSELQSKFPDSRFCFVKTQEQLTKILCLDCGGSRVYVPGPGFSLMNFEVHLKNKSHLANLALRLNKEQHVSPQSEGSSPPPFRKRGPFISKKNGNLMDPERPAPYAMKKPSPPLSSSSSLPTTLPSSSSSSTLTSSTSSSSSTSLSLKFRPPSTWNPTQASSSSSSSSSMPSHLYARDSRPHFSSFPQTLHHQVDRDFVNDDDDDDDEMEEGEIKHHPHYRRQSELSSFKRYSESEGMEDQEYSEADDDMDDQREYRPAYPDSEMDEDEENYDHDEEVDDEEEEEEEEEEEDGQLPMRRNLRPRPPSSPPPVSSPARPYLNSTFRIRLPTVATVTTPYADQPTTSASQFHHFERQNEDDEAEGEEEEEEEEESESGSDDF